MKPAAYKIKGTTVFIEVSDNNNNYSCFRHNICRGWSCLPNAYYNIIDIIMLIIVLRYYYKYYYNIAKSYLRIQMYSVKTCFEVETIVFNFNFFFFLPKT